MTLNDLTLRARALLRPNRVEQELDEELAFHIEREARRLIDEGMRPAEARERAQARFGSTALVADRCRDERGIALIDSTIRDIQYALRSFTKAPLAAFTIVVTVAVGLGVIAGSQHHVAAGMATHVEPPVVRPCRTQAEPIVVGIGTADEHFPAAGQLVIPRHRRP